MQRADFAFDLPDELLARYPTAQRRDSRLLCLSEQGLVHRQFSALIDLLVPGDHLVLNNTKVMQARLLARKTTGGMAELLVERILSPHTAWVHCRASKRPKIGSVLHVNADIFLTVSQSQQDLLEVTLSGYASFQALLSDYGQLPLPPYFGRPAEPDDQQRYQTVYAQHLGSVAAPTAGLHFDADLLSALVAKGISVSFITLHVGAGTFQPLREDTLTQGILHSEYAELTPTVCAAIRHTQQQGGRIIAVGTTTVRTLETAALSGTLQPFAGETRLFIQPGFIFNCVDALLTNFHLSESTLLMLVCAFGGQQAVMAAYAEAIHQRYRFYSYGDAMWVLPCVKR